MNRKLLILLFCFMGLFHGGISQEAWTIGPMIHLNFGGEKMKFSYSIESAYWNYENFPYSIDAGLEFESGRFRVYSEFQTGIGLAGVSFGPVFELNNNKTRSHFGFQGSIWGNYFLGFDVRLRRIEQTTYKSPGAYFKLPFVPGSNNNSNRSHHNWDWD